MSTRNGCCRCTIRLWNWRWSLGATQSNPRLWNCVIQMTLEHVGIQWRVHGSQIERSVLLSQLHDVQIRFLHMKTIEKIDIEIEFNEY